MERRDGATTIRADRSGRPPHRPALRGAGLPGATTVTKLPRSAMEGSSLARDTEHGRAVTAQLTRRHGTLEEAIDAGDLRARRRRRRPSGIRRQARAACEDYFYNRLEPDAGLRAARGPDAIAGGLELLPDPMYKALEDVVELVVDGECEDLRAAVARSARRSRTCAVASRTTARRRWCCRRARSTGSRPIAKSDEPGRCRAGPTSSSCGPKTGPAQPAHRGRARGVGRALHGHAERHPALTRDRARRSSRRTRLADRSRRTGHRARTRERR